MPTMRSLIRILRTPILCSLFLLAPVAPAFAADQFPATVAKVKPGVVGIATFQKTRTPIMMYRGTGFVVGDGLSVITNAHVLPAVLDLENREQFGVVVGTGPAAGFRTAEVVGVDQEYDLAHLRLSGNPLPALKLGDSSKVREGQSIAFTGFPLGMMLGPYHVTHRGMVSSISPMALPQRKAGQLDPKTIARLKQGPVTIFQLDGTAYPGNSGSPIYHPDSGEVLGVISMVRIKEAKEGSSISQPSGISYAIPSNHVRMLLDQSRP